MAYDIRSQDHKKLEDSLKSVNKEQFLKKLLEDYG
jgi:hypothetical protein